MNLDEAQSYTSCYLEAAHNVLQFLVLELSVVSLAINTIKHHDLTTLPIDFSQRFSAVFSCHHGFISYIGILYKLLLNMAQSVIPKPVVLIQTRCFAFYRYLWGTTQAPDGRHCSATLSKWRGRFLISRVVGMDVVRIGRFVRKIDSPQTRWHITSEFLVIGLIKPTSFPTTSDPW